MSDSDIPRELYERIEPSEGEEEGGREGERVILKGKDVTDATEEVMVEAITSSTRELPLQYRDTTLAVKWLKSAAKGLAKGMTKGMVAVGEYEADYKAQRTLIEVRRASCSGRSANTSHRWVQSGGMVKQVPTSHVQVHVPTNERNFEWRPVPIGDKHQAVVHDAGVKNRKVPRRSNAEKQYLSRMNEQQVWPPIMPEVTIREDSPGSGDECLRMMGGGEPSVADSAHLFCEKNRLQYDTIQYNSVTAHCGAWSALGAENAIKLGLGEMGWITGMGWTPREEATFAIAMETGNKNLAYVARMMKTRTRSEVVSYYWNVWKMGYTQASRTYWEKRDLEPAEGGRGGGGIQLQTHDKEGRMKIFTEKIREDEPLESAMKRSRETGRQHQQQQPKKRKKRNDFTEEKPSGTSERAEEEAGRQSRPRKLISGRKIARKMATWRTPQLGTEHLNRNGTSEPKEKRKMSEKQLNGNGQSKASSEEAGQLKVKKKKKKKKHKEEETQKKKKRKKPKPAKGADAVSWLRHLAKWAKFPANYDLALDSPNKSNKMVFLKEAREKQRQKLQ